MHLIELCTNLVNQTAPTSVLDVLHHQHEEGATLAQFLRHKGMSKAKSIHSTACSVVTSVCIQSIDLYSRQVQINVNHTLIFTLGTFKTLIITLAEISLVIPKFQHGSQKLCQSGQTFLPHAGDAIHPALRWEQSGSRD